MKTTDIIRRAGRNLRRAKMRTFLTSVAIAVGGFAIMISLMAGEGVRQYIDRIIGSSLNSKGLTIAKDKELLLSDKSKSSNDIALSEYDPDAGRHNGREYKTISDADIEKLRQNPQLKHVEPSYQLRPKYLSFSSKEGKKYLSNLMMRDDSVRIEAAMGKTFEPGMALKDDEAIIPEDYLSRLGTGATKNFIGTKVVVTIAQMPQNVDNAALTKALREGGEAAALSLTAPKLLNKEFTIVSVAKKSSSQLAIQSNIYISSGAAKELSDFSTAGTEMYQKYFTINASVADGLNPEDVKESLKRDGFSSMTAKDVQSTFFQMVDMIQSIVIGFGALALIVSVFGIINTMYISVLERTQQIGLMKALGASRRDIGRLFRYEAAWVGFLGGVLGVLGAWGAGAVLNPIAAKQMGLGEHGLLVFVPLQAAVVVASLMLIAIVAGFLPSRKAAKLDPIEALRTE